GKGWSTSSEPVTTRCEHRTFPEPSDSGTDRHRQRDRACTRKEEMRSNKILAATLASLLTLAACGGGGDSGSGDGDGGERAQPAWGVPPSTDPLPLPEQGERYDNPQDRENIKDGGTLKLPIAELGPNFNQFS